MAWAMWHRSVSPPRSSNRTCRFPASGSPTGFTSRPTAWSKRHADEVQDAKLPEHDLGWQAPRASPLHLATIDEGVAHTDVDIVVDRRFRPRQRLARVSAPEDDEVVGIGDDMGLERFVPTSGAPMLEKAVYCTGWQGGD